MSPISRRSNSRRTVAYAAGTPWVPRTIDTAATERPPPSEPTLDKVLAEGTLPIERARRIGESLARALAQIHATGRALGDLQPSRIKIVSRDGVEHAEIQGLHEPRERDEAEPPAARYMAPEQVHAHGVSASCDIYTLGVMLFEMVAGCAPIHGRTTMELMIRKTIEDAPALAQVCSAATPSYAVLVDACLARDPRSRPSSAAEVAARLVEAGRPRETVELSSRPRRGATVVVATRPARVRVRAEIVALGAAVGVTLAALAYALMEDDTDSPWGERVRGNLLSPVDDAVP